MLKPCTINGNELDSPAFDITTGKSDSTFPVSDEHHVMDGGGMLGCHTNMTSSSVQNTETSASASVHYDAIGLPLLTENVANYETASCHNSVLSVQEAAFELSGNHVIKHDLDNGMMSSSNTLHDDAVTADGISSPFTVSSASLSASDIQVPCEDSKVLDSCVGSDENITNYCEKTDALEANANDENIASSITSSTASHLEYTDGISIQPSRQNIETIHWDLNDAQTPVDESCDIHVLSTDSVIASEAVVAVQEEMVVDSGDSCISQLSQTITENLDEEDDGVDEVDKTVPSLYRVHHPTVSMNSRFEEGAPSHGHDHLLDDNKKPTDLDVSESLWLEKECDEMCGTDHVERITVDSVSKLRVKVEVGSHTEVCCVDGYSPPAECSSESDLVVDAHETKEASAHLTECEMDNDNKDTVASRVPMQSDIHLSLDTDHPAASLPCSVSALDADVIDSGLRRPEEIPTDIIDSMYDVSAANDQNKVDSLESLQKPVSDEMSIHHISVDKLEVTDVIRPLSVNDAGDAVNAELHQKPLKLSKDDGGDSLRVVLSDSIAVDTQNTMTLKQAFPEIQLNGDLTVEKGEGLEVPSYTASSVEPDVQEVDLSMVSERGDEQQKSGLNNMPSTSLKEQLEGSVNTHCLPVDQAVDISAFNADMDNNVNEGTDVINKAKSVVYSRAETQTPSTDDMPAQDLEQRQSDEDAERWFEEQFAACEDFDVDEFVSSAWSAFHLDSEPAVGNIHDEMLEQTLAAAGDIEPVHSDTADAWHYVENTVVSASSVDDSYEPSSSEYMANEMEPTCYPPSSPQPGVTNTLLPVPGNFLITDWLFVQL